MKTQNLFEKAVMAVVEKHFDKELTHEKILDATITDISSGANPKTVTVQPSFNDINGLPVPEIRGLKIDNQNLPRDLQIGDKVRIGFCDGNVTQPYILDYATNIYDTTNRMYWDTNNEPHFVSGSDNITLKKGAAVSAPTGGAFIDAEARTSINEIRAILTLWGVH